jgi:hypothetical protein
MCCSHLMNQSRFWCKLNFIVSPLLTWFRTPLSLFSFSAPFSFSLAYVNYGSLSVFTVSPLYNSLILDLLCDSDLFWVFPAIQQVSSIPIQCVSDPFWPFVDFIYLRSYRHSDVLIIYSYGWLHYYYRFGLRSLQTISHIRSLRHHFDLSKVIFTYILPTTPITYRE